MLDWKAPAHWQRFVTIDLHTAGEPLRMIIDGFPDVPGSTMLEKRRYARTHFDHLRRALMWEPRGHADMYGCILTPPVTEDGDVGVLFMHNEGFSTMCGHGIIALVKAGIETGRFAIHGPRTVIRIDTPAGRVTATAHIHANHVERVSFLNVPSFLLKRDLKISVRGIGLVGVDIAFGGAFYAYADADALGLQLVPENQRQLIDVGMDIKRAVTAAYAITHPAGAADLNFLYGTIFIHRYPKNRFHSRNVCIFAEGEVDRSPTGTGVSGRLAIHHARGELALGETITVESLIGTQFQGAVNEITQVGTLAAIVPEVSGTAHIVGRSEFYIDPDDPLADGFLIR